MKKLLSAIAILMAVSAVHAASINWSVTLATKVLKDYGDANNYNSTVYLILATDVSSITSTTQDKASFLAALDAITLNAAYSATDGKMSGISKVVVTDESLTSGESTNFGLLIHSEAEDGSGYYKLLTAYANPYATGASSDAQTDIKTSWSALGNKDWVQGYAAQEPDPGPGGDDPTPGVPEPATGALALAGLALLFRRRRA